MQRSSRSNRVQILIDRPRRAKRGRLCSLWLQALLTGFYVSPSPRLPVLTPEKWKDRPSRFVVAMGIANVGQNAVGNIFRRESVNYFVGNCLLGQDVPLLKTTKAQNSIRVFTKSAFTDEPDGISVATSVTKNRTSGWPTFAALKTAVRKRNVRLDATVEEGIATIIIWSRITSVSENSAHNISLFS